MDSIERIGGVPRPVGEVGVPKFTSQVDLSQYGGVSGPAYQDQSIMSLLARILALLEKWLRNLFPGNMRYGGFEPEPYLNSFMYGGFDPYNPRRDPFGDYSAFDPVGTARLGNGGF